MSVSKVKVMANPAEYLQFQNSVNEINRQIQSHSETGLCCCIAASFREVEFILAFSREFNIQVNFPRFKIFECKRLTQLYFEMACLNHISAKGNISIGADLQRVQTILLRMLECAVFARFSERLLARLAALQTESTVERLDSLYNNL